MTKITSLQIENVKRVKAVHLEPSANGLTVIGGKNRQGKTSVLDAITWALGGNKYAPTKPQRDGSLNPPAIDITLDNGIRVTRKGKASTLTVIDPSGQKAGQALLDEFVGTFALDLPKFLNSNAKDKASALLKALGIGDKLLVLDRDEKRLYDERTAVGRIADSKRKHADELPEYADAPEEPVSVSDLLKQHQAILEKNASNSALRNQVDQLTEAEARTKQRIAELRAALNALTEELETIEQKLSTARISAADLRDESTAEIEASIENIEAINAQISANAAKQIAADEAATYTAQYDDLTAQIEDVRTARAALLEGAELPLPGLTYENGEVLFNGIPWDGMSGAEELKVAVAVVRKLNPNCGFVLMDKLEQMDRDTLEEFNSWLEQEGLQVIATRVSTGEECSIVIEDGLPVGQSYADVVTGVNAAPESPFGEF